MGSVRSPSKSQRSLMVVRPTRATTNTPTHFTLREREDMFHINQITTLKVDWPLKHFILSSIWHSTRVHCSFYRLLCNTCIRSIYALVGFFFTLNGSDVSNNYSKQNNNNTTTTRSIYALVGFFFTLNGSDVSNNYSKQNNNNSNNNNNKVYIRTSWVLLYP